MKQLFANLFNCGRLYEIFNTDIPLYEKNDVPVEQIERLKEEDETRKAMTENNLGGNYIGTDDEGARCELELKTAEESARNRYSAKTHTPRSNLI